MAALAIAAFLCVAMAGAWVVGDRSGRSGQVDAIWTFATGAACLAAIWLGANQPARAGLAAVYLAIWSIRLGSYLWKRAEHGEDPRYAALKQQWGDKARSRLFLFLQIQAVSSWPLAISAYVAAASPRPAPDLADLAAVLVFAAALGGEAVADRQMAAFKADPANKGGVCERGLWGWSRHPNYFFEWLGWLGLPLLAMGLNYPWGWLAWLAPAWMFVLLRYVSGVPPLEESMRRSRGAKFEDYAARVNAFWPAPPRSRQPAAD
jgi:steroid 5-alpha reductase family enzyme